MGQKKANKKDKRKEKSKEKKRRVTPELSSQKPEQMLVELNNKIKKNLWGLEQNRQKLAKLIELSIEKIEQLKVLFQQQQQLEEEIKAQKKEDSSPDFPSQTRKEAKQRFFNYLKNCEEQLKQFSPLLQSPASASASIPIPPQKPVKTQLPGQKDQKKKILIIEDEAIIIKSVSYFLVNAGFEVLFALNPEEGIKKAIQEQPDLILLDIVMPGLNGYQVLGQLKKNSATTHIPVIILSALSRESDILEGLDRGATDYLTKPFSPEILLSKIKKVLTKKNDTSDLHRSL